MLLGARSHGGQCHCASLHVARLHKALRMRSAHPQIERSIHVVAIVVDDHSLVTIVVAYLRVAEQS